VLDEIEFIWAPEDTPRCVGTETVPATRDIRQKPYILVYETDRKLGFKTDAVAGYRTEKSYTVEDGPDTLNSWPQPKTAWRLFRKIVAEETGLSTKMALKTSLLGTRANRRTIDSNSLRRS